MKQFNVYENPSGMKEAVKQGWSWPGFFFNWIWCFVKKMSGLGFGVLGAYFGIGILSGILEMSEAYGLSIIVNLAGIGVSIWVGSNGNEKRQENLISRGYELKTTVSASNPEGAIAMYTKENQE